MKTFYEILKVDPSSSMKLIDSKIKQREKYLKKSNLEKNLKKEKLREVENMKQTLLIYKNRHKYDNSIEFQHSFQMFNNFSPFSSPIFKSSDLSFHGTPPPSEYQIYSVSKVMSPEGGYVKEYSNLNGKEEKNEYKIDTPYDSNEKFLY